MLAADWVTLLFAAVEGDGPPVPVAVLAERTAEGWVLDQRRDLRLPPQLLRRLSGQRPAGPGRNPAIPRDLRHDGSASLALPLAVAGGMAQRGPAILLVERRAGSPFSREEAALADKLARRLEAALARARIVERARSDLDAALAALASGDDVRDAVRAALEAIATWTGAEDVVLTLPPAVAGTPGVAASRGRRGTFTWDEGAIPTLDHPEAPLGEAAGPDVQIVPRPEAAGGSAGGTSARALIPLLDVAAAALDVTWADTATGADVARLASAAIAAAPVIAHLRGRLARDAGRRRLDTVARTMDRIAKAPDVGAAARALIEGGTELAGADGASVRLERGVFGANPAYVNVIRGPDGVEWTDIAVAADGHTDEALQRWGSSRVVDLVAEAETGNVLAQQLLRDYGFESGLIVPIRARGKVVGTLRLASRRRRAFDGMSGLHLQALADHAGAVVEQALLESQAGERLRRLNVAQRIAAAVNTADDSDGVARRLLEAAQEATGCSRGEVALVDVDRAVLRTRARLGGDASDVSVHRLYTEPSPDEDDLAFTLRTGLQRLLWSWPEGDEGVRACTVLTPILHAGKPVGVLSLTWDRGPPTVDLALLGLIAGQAGGAVARGRLAQAEQAARAKLTTGLEASSTVILTVSEHGLVEQIEGDAAAMLGLPPQRILGAPFLDLFVPDERATELAGLLAQGESELRERSFQARARHADGHHVPVLVVVAPRFEGQNRAGAVAALTDLTEMTALTRELDEANAARSRAEGAVRTGRAIVHDLGSPLSTILALSEMLVEDARLPDRARGDAALLSAEAVRASTLLHRFGRITRYEELSTPIGPQLDVERSTGP